MYRRRSPLPLMFLSAVVLMPALSRAEIDTDDEGDDEIALGDPDGGASLRVDVDSAANPVGGGPLLAADGGEAVTLLMAGPDGGYPYGIDGRCLDLEQESGPLGDILGSLRLEVSGAHVALQELRLVGLTSLDPKAVAGLVGVQVGPLSQALSPELAAVLVARLAGTGLFEQVTPRVLEEVGGQGVLEVELREFPRVTAVDLTGVTESKPEDVLRALLEAPAVHPAHRAKHKQVGFHIHIKEVDDAIARFVDSLPVHHRAGCGWVRPPSTWLALPAGSTVVPGIVWHGLPRSVERTVNYLRARGYLLATVRARLTADGVLHVEVDEGRIQEVRLEGVNPAIEERVRDWIGVKAGDVLLASEVHRGVDQVVANLSFLHIAESHHLYSGPFRIETEKAADGSVAYRVVAQPPPSVGRRGSKGEADADDEESDDDASSSKGGAKGHVAPKVLGADLQDHVLTLYFEDHPWSGSEMDWYELIRHTQVTGFAPGLGGTLRYADPGARVNVAIDGQLNINSRRASFNSDGDLLAKLGSQQRIDWLVGPKVQLPGLHVAELGVQAHSITDTTDRWHMDALDSYLDSAWENRPDSYYFRRSGASAYLTTHFLDRLTVGAEYRIDRYEGMSALNHVWTVLNQDEHAYPNPTFGGVEAGSIVGRVEFSTERRSIDKVGNRRHDPETSLVAWTASKVTSYRTVNTIEVANPSLGGESSFTRVVSDHKLYLASTAASGLTLRVRGAGENGLVPLPKQETLGGWDALRGYGFDEFRGDRSILGSAEYRWQILGAFADVGTVRQTGGEWVTPRLGLGGELALGDDVHLEAAWRTDSRATGAPSVRLLFQRTF